MPLRPSYQGAFQSTLAVEQSRWESGVGVRVFARQNSALGVPEWPRKSTGRPALTANVRRIAAQMYVIRGESVMVDADLAELYQVETGALVRAMKRNADRFPEDFAFQLNSEEFADLRSQTGISSWGGRRYCGLSSVLTCATATRLGSGHRYRQGHRLAVAVGCSRADGRSRGVRRGGSRVRCPCGCNG